MNGRMLEPIEIDLVWPDVEKWISDACEYNGGRYAAEDIKSALKSGTEHLWLAIEGGEIFGVVTTEIIQYPRKKCAVIGICTGKELTRWGGLVSLIDEWAKRCGCDQMFLPARMGMDRLLKINGYRKTHHFYEKNLRS